MKTSSTFGRPRDRNAAAIEELTKLEGAVSKTPRLPPAQTLMAIALLGPMRDEPPDRSAAAEAALVILLISLAEGRPLNVVDPSAGDIAQGNKRLEGDRVLSERVSQWLGKKNIPATQGALQSNTYRSGYVAGQAQVSALGDFAGWLSEGDRTIEEVRDVATVLLAGFLRKAVTLPPLPRLHRDRLTAVKFRQIAETLFSGGSHGAFEQYLVAGVLRAELIATGRAVRAETKSAKVSDRTSGASGDVEIRQGQSLIEAIEVTAGNWTTKLGQIAAGARHLDAVTVVARGVHGIPAQKFDEELGKDPRLASVDVSFVELMGLIDFCSSRLDGGGRADALSFVYQCLARWHRSEPGLIASLVQAVEDAGVTENDGSAEVTPADVETEEEATAVAQRLITRLEQGNFLGDEGLAADLQRLSDLATADEQTKAE